MRFRSTVLLLPYPPPLLPFACGRMPASTEPLPRVRTRDVLGIRQTALARSSSRARWRARHFLRAGLTLCQFPGQQHCALVPRATRSPELSHRVLVCCTLFADKINTGFAARIIRVPYSRSVVRAGLYAVLPPYPHGRWFLARLLVGFLLSATPAWHACSPRGRPGRTRWHIATRSVSSFCSTHFSWRLPRPNQQYAHTYPMRSVSSFLPTPFALSHANHRPSRVRAVLNCHLTYARRENASGVWRSTFLCRYRISRAARTLSGLRFVRSSLCRRVLLRWFRAFLLLSLRACPSLGLTLAF